MAALAVPSPNMLVSQNQAFVQVWKEGWSPVYKWVTHLKGQIQLSEPMFLSHNRHLQSSQHIIINNYPKQSDYMVKISDIYSVLIIPNPR